MHLPDGETWGRQIKYQKEILRLLHLLPARQQTQGKALCLYLPTYLATYLSMYLSLLGFEWSRFMKGMLGNYTLAQNTPSLHFPHFQ